MLGVSKDKNKQTLSALVYVEQRDTWNHNWPHKIESETDRKQINSRENNIKNSSSTTTATTTTTTIDLPKRKK